MKRLWQRLAAWFARFPGPHRPHMVIAAVLLVVALGLRVRAVGQSIPYCNHVDENTWASIALRMLQTGDLNPHRFRKPSLPVYLMAGGFSVGLAGAMITGDASGTSDLGKDAAPYYLVPKAAVVPKVLFATSSVVAMGFAGVIGFVVTGRPILLWLVPLLASLAPTYYRLSWTYMNVDVAGALFALATVMYLVLAQAADLRLGREPNVRRRALIAGVLAGLTIGCKYNLFPILVPCVLWFVLYARRQALRATLLVGAASFATFLVTTPYALLDYRAFFTDVGKEMEHYATGHIGRTYPPGLAMLWRHALHFVEDMGALPFFISVAGMAAYFRSDWKKALILFSYALVFVAFMSTQHVFFERNLMGAQLFVVLALGIAFLELPQLVSTLAARVAPSLPLDKIRRGSVVVLGLLVLLGLPWNGIKLAYASIPEPRVGAVDWIKENTPKGSLVLIERKLKVDTRSFTRDHTVIGSRMPDDEELLASLDPARPVVVMTHPRALRRYLDALPGAKLKLRLRYWSDIDPGDLRAVLVVVRPGVVLPPPPDRARVAPRRQ